MNCGECGTGYMKEFPAESLSRILGYEDHLVSGGLAASSPSLPQLLLNSIRASTAALSSLGVTAMSDFISKVYSRNVSEETGRETRALLPSSLILYHKSNLYSTPQLYDFCTSITHPSSNICEDRRQACFSGPGSFLCLYKPHVLTPGFPLCIPGEKQGEWKAGSTVT